MNDSLRLMFAMLATAGVAACGGGSSTDPVPATSTTTTAPSTSTPGTSTTPTTSTPGTTTTTGGGTTGSTSPTTSTPGASTSTTPSPAPTPTPTPTPTPAPATPSASGDCNSNDGIFSVAGNNAQFDANIYAADGSTVLLKSQNKITVKSGGNFRGTNELTELSQDTTTTYTSASANGSLAGTSVNTNVKSYFKANGTDYLTYGLVTTATMPVLGTYAVTTYVTPAWGWPIAPALNTPYTRTYTTTNEATAYTAASTSTQTVTQTYLGVEQVSVPAGTFSGCKYKSETTVSGTTTVTYGYIVASGRLKGHILKTENAAGVKTLEATVLLLNGS